MSNMKEADTVEEIDDGAKDSNDACTSFTSMKRADMLDTHDLLATDENSVLSGGASANVREVKTVNEDDLLERGDGIPIVRDGAANFRELGTAESEDLEGSDEAESIKCDGTIDMDDSIDHADGKLCNAMESLSLGNVDLHHGDAGKNKAAHESRDSGTVEDDAPLPSESSKAVSDRQGITVEDDNSDLISNQDEHLCQRQHSKLRTSDTIDDNGKSMFHKQISFHDEVFVPMAPCPGNKMGSSRKKMDSVQQGREAETVDESPFEPYMPEVPQTLRTVSLNPAKIIFKVIQVRKSEHNKDSPIKGLPMEPLLKSAGESLIFGRGVGVDVYLQDLLASKKHLEMNVILHPLRVTFRNISEKKPVLVNGTSRLEPTSSCFVNNNDSVTIGCTTFLVEFVEGDLACNRFKLMFCNLTNEPSFIPSYVSSGASQVSNSVSYASQSLGGAQSAPNFEAMSQPKPMQQYSYFQNAGLPFNSYASQPMSASYFHAQPQVPTGYPFVGNSFIPTPQFMPNVNTFAYSPSSRFGNQMQPLQPPGGYNVPLFAQNSAQEYSGRLPMESYHHSGSVPVQHDETSRAMQESEMK